MEKKINIGQKAKVIITLTTKSSITKEEENSVIALFAKKYGIPEKNVRVDNIIVTDGNSSAEDSLNSNNVKSIHDPIFQQLLFKQYAAENEIELTEDEFNEIVKIDSRINSQIDYDAYEKGKKYIVKWIDWDNFLSYGKGNHFDFTTLKGLVLLNGEPANKSGKSTFAYDLLHFLLFGKTESGKSDDLGGLFNNYLPNETQLKVEGCICIDGVDYIIKRTLTRAAKSKKEVRTASQKVEYYRVLQNGEREELVDYENLQDESSVKTNKIIKESIGDEKDFDLIISANMKDLDELISLKKDARGKLLSRWIGLSILEDKDEIARKIWNKEITVGRYCDIYNRETLKSEIETLEKENEELKKQITTNKKRIEDSEKSINHQNELKEEKLKGKRPVDQELLNVGDVTTLEAKRDKIIEDGKKKVAELEVLNKELSDYGTIVVDEEQYKNLQEEKEQIIEKQATLKSQYESLKKNNEDLTSAEFCPLCKRKFDNIDNSGLIKENDKKIAYCINEGKKLKSRKEEIIPLMEEIERKRERLREKNKLEIRIAALNIQVVTLRSDCISINNTIKQLNDNKEAIKINNAIDAEILAINESIKIQENIKLTASTENVSYIETGKKNKEKIGEKKGIIEKIEDEQKAEKIWKIYLKMIGKDGISKIVLKNTLPIINNEINRLLNGVTDFDVEVAMNAKNDVDFWLIRDGVKTRLSGSSGLERTQAALALRVVLGNMSRLCKPDFILLDEVLGGVAKENYDDMKKLYDKIVKNFRFILHICHLDPLIDWHTGGIITVKKENNISSIKAYQ